MATLPRRHLVVGFAALALLATQGCAQVSPNGQDAAPIPGASVSAPVSIPATTTASPAPLPTLTPTPTP
ncbi:MAG TPA: hypothetical protein VLR88_01110, partial [Propionibacteriaceae bacterium]|nr:hypothetical protein [Propionibacteriaceae bacterium]